VMLIANIPDHISNARMLFDPEAIPEPRLNFNLDSRLINVCNKLKNQFLSVSFFVLF